MIPDYSSLHEIEYYQEHTRNYQIRYCALIHHQGLNKYRTLKDLSEHILSSKILNAFEVWDGQYHRKIIQEKKAVKKSNTEEREDEAKKILSALDEILLHTLEIDDTVNWEILKDRSTFDKAEPENVILKDYKKPPQRPNKSVYEPSFGFFDSIFSSLKNKKIAKAEKTYKSVLEEYESVKKEIETENKKIKKINDASEKEHAKKLKSWKNEKKVFETNRKNKNDLVDKLKEDYHNGDSNAIIQYCEIVLNNSDYSNFNFPQDYNIDYSIDNKTLVVDYMLPAIEDLPTLKQVKFVATRNEIKEVHLSERELAGIYDQVIYKITLRSIHEILEADEANLIEAVGFNGWVNSLNKAIGKIERSCIVSVHTTKSEFLDIDLSMVDPKQCFKGLKGIGSSKLSSLTPIKPIIQLDKNDKRFIMAVDVADTIAEGYNLATMDWEDFEHLVREIFEKEFSVNGGEVKVTQSSRDGGVDAIAFDPDPIRGGKIVIQAKRYTNTVGVSAIRDLYGTTVNEGAIKGIIVTTSDYGSDAHSFAKDKPLTLLNGNHLLHLLGKHGHKAKIDIPEAKRLRNEL